MDPHLSMKFQDEFGIAINTHTLDLSLCMIFLDDFSVVANPCTWDPSSPYYFNIVVSTHTWDSSLWLYILTTSAERNALQKGMEFWNPL